MVPENRESDMKVYRFGLLLVLILALPGLAPGDGNAGKSMHQFTVKSLDGEITKAIESACHARGGTGG